MRMRRILTVVLVLCVLVGVMAATGAATKEGGVNRFELRVIPNAETELFYDWGWTLNEEIATIEGELIGWNGGPCMQLSPDPDATDRFWCDFGMQLPDGTIIFGGPVSLDDYMEGKIVFAVTGGTGKFRNIHGEVRLVPEEDLSYATLIFRVKGAKIDR
jgi:hypothetical protein